MKRAQHSYKETQTPTAGSIFDREDPDEADLWFLPQTEGPNPEPLPPKPARPLFDPADWARAQGDLSADLARLTLRFGMFSERLNRLGKGAVHRLAIREASELSWWTGERIGIERLTLWLGQRMGGGLHESLAISQAGWAVRRLTAGLAPDASGWKTGLTGFLGHSEVSTRIEDLAEVMQTVHYLHPVTQAAVLFHAWRLIGQSGGACDTEAHVLAACHGASMVGPSASRRSAFLPLVMAGVGAVQVTGSAHRRLAGWLGGAEQAVLSALAQLEKLENWQASALNATSDLTGRTPRLLIEALLAWPTITAAIAEAHCAASRAAVQRNLDILTARGLIREITGQGRYRVWVAAV